MTEGGRGRVAGGYGSRVSIRQAREQCRVRRAAVPGDLAECLLHRWPVSGQVLQQCRRRVRVDRHLRDDPDSVPLDHGSQLGFGQARVRRDGLDHLRVGIAGQRVADPGRQIASLGQEHPHGRVR
jgi:hypothetical protein